MNNLEFYRIEDLNDEPVDETYVTAIPAIAWESDEPIDELIAAFHKRIAIPEIRLGDERTIRNSDGNVVTVHTVHYMDNDVSVDTLGYVHTWNE